jgi:YD repeat-containing protein
VGTTTFTYTPEGRVQSVVYDYTASGLPQPQEIEYAYNPDGSRASMTWQWLSGESFEWQYNYDAGGRLKSLTNPWNETTSWTYDGEDKVLTQTDANNTAVAYTYNPQRGWPTSVVYDLNGTPAGFPSLAYDGGMNTLGLLTNITEMDGTTDDYGYDALSRLTSETRSDPNGNPEDGHAYGYDLAGNRTTEDGGAFVTPDATNCPTAIVAQGVTLARDADGNITGSLPSAPGLFAWDDRNKLVTLNVGNGAYVLQYGYDALGHCVFESLENLVQNEH